MMSPKNKRILIVDDEIHVLECYQYVLESHMACEVTQARSGEEALEILDRNHFDAMVLDLMMPEKTGFDVLKTLQEWNRYCPTVISTGYGSPSSLIYAFSYGVIDMLPKPLNHRMIVQRTQQAIEWHERFEHLTKGDIHIQKLGEQDLMPYAFYCLQTQHFELAYTLLEQAKIHHDPKECSMLQGMIREVQKDFGACETHYRDALALYG